MYLQVFSCATAGKPYFSSRLSPNGETEQSGLFGVALHLELSEACSVPFNGLGHLPVHRVQLHGSNNTVLLNRTYKPGKIPSFKPKYFQLLQWAPVLKCQLEATISVWHQCGSWWSDSPPGWSGGQRLWLVGSRPPCSSGTRRCLWPAPRCSERSTSRRSHRLSLCEPSSCSSFQC